MPRDRERNDASGNLVHALVLMEKKIWQIIPVFGFSFCLALVFTNYFMPSPESMPGQLMNTRSVLVVDAITGLAFLYLMLQPERMAVYAYIFFLNGCLNIIDGGDMVGCLMFYLTFSIALRLGFFQKRHVIKLVLFFSALAAALLSQLRLGTAKFLHSILFSGVMLLMLGFQFFIMRQYFSDLMPIRKKKINLASYPLQERDYDLIRRVLADEKYSSIAMEYSVTESAIKQRMRQIYRIFDVRDRNAFLLLCSGAEINYHHSRHKSPV